MKIIDCFIFYNETDLLDYRLEILKETVDTFVLIEATRTHVGIHKDLNFNPDNYRNFNIVSFIDDDFPYHDVDVSKQQQWVNENHQRDCIDAVIKKLNLSGDDIIIISDIDEIPDPRTIKGLRTFDLQPGIYSLEQDLYYCTLKSLANDKWNYAKLMKYRDYLFSGMTPSDLRFRKQSDFVIKNGGWHLSYFGDPEFIANKIQNFTHQEYNDPKFTDTDKIIERIQSGRDLFDRGDVKLTLMDMDTNGYLPYRWYLLTKPSHPLKHYYHNKLSIPSDINEHLHILFGYASSCESIFETGVRGVVSSYAFAYGLTFNNFPKKKLIVNDIVECDVGELSDLCKLYGVEFSSVWGNNLNVTLYDSVDLTFIDTWHVYGQLKRELNRFAKYTKKYIIMHDTTVDEVYGETLRLKMDPVEQEKLTGIPVDEICKGLGPAIDEFLKENPVWVLFERFTNNNGLTILKRV
jgi:beta-1,4-mannosyl-glycoprotein beta-1,4-N-acetylglucosaminyltransferase